MFTTGLIASIIVLKITMEKINPIRRQQLISSFYGLAVLSFVPKLVFVIVISVLYLTNFMFSENESLIIVPVIGVLSGFLPFSIILYGVFKTLYRFKLHHHIISFKNLPSSFGGLRIVQLSDIHLGSFNYRFHIIERAIEKVNRLEPDYIFFTGDLVNNYAWELRGWKKIFKKLNAGKGKYAVFGNHDYGDYSTWKTMADKLENKEKIKQFFRDIDFKLLLNESEIISKNRENIVIIGVENWGAPPLKQYGDLQKALEGVNAIPFKILLSHNPMHWSQEVINKTDIALTLSGHTHGMQAAFQYKNSQWSPIQYKFKHWAGLYQYNHQYLYVNRGLGWLGFPARIGMRPEITLLELQSIS
jgi:predicted MPP superfamily phosphohydrolase